MSGVVDEFLTEARDISLFRRVQIGHEAHPASCSVGTGALPLVIQQLRHETHCSLLSTANVRRYTLLPPHAFMACIGTTLSSYFVSSYVDFNSSLKTNVETGGKYNFTKLETTVGRLFTDLYTKI